jgi:hypothetical protein
VVGDKGLTEEFYYDGTVFGRRIYKPDGSLFSDKSIPVGVETDAVSIDERPIKVTVVIVTTVSLLHALYITQRFKFSCSATAFLSPVCNVLYNHDHCVEFGV